ncbi:uncharacterized protein LOC110190560 [Drosophila serrata]|uniref:uncharacterized protein LOC110190560 n=1 Tax=Drosophila serrata TaxID=7274 RepID=UPI000A1D1638|nr:uncharacterized protein LOC110190560 [Drosophila serrata]
MQMPFTVRSSHPSGLPSFCDRKRKRTKGKRWKIEAANKMLFATNCSSCSVAVPFCKCKCKKFNLAISKLCLNRRHKLLQYFDGCGTGNPLRCLSGGWKLTSYCYLLPGLQQLQAAPYPLFWKRRQWDTFGLPPPLLLTPFRLHGNGNEGQDRGQERHLLRPRSRQAN